MTSLLSIVLALVVLGVILYVIGLIPIDATIKKVINVVVILAVVLWLLRVIFGIGLPGIHIN